MCMFVVLLLNLFCFNLLAHDVVESPLLINPCVICNNELPTEWPAKVDICVKGDTKHSFCTQCLYDLFQVKEQPLTCPLCKDPISLGKRNLIIASWFLLNRGLNKDTVFTICSLLETHFNDVEQQFLQLQRMFKEEMARTSELEQDKKNIQYHVQELTANYEKAVAERALLVQKQ